jgi:hypothetical protein
VSKWEKPSHRNRKSGQRLENRQQVCPACFENFATTEAGDAHRGRKGDSPVCLNPELVGLSKIVNKYGTEVWE